MNEKIKVYAKPDLQSQITAVDSSIFLTDTTGWVLIDEGAGNKFAHAQVNYFDKPLMTTEGVCRYKMVDGVAVAKTDAEIAAEENAITKAADKQIQIAALKIQLSTTDYKVIKCSECSLAGLPLPYNITELNIERQSLRDQINTLEKQLNVV